MFRSALSFGFLIQGQMDVIKNIVNTIKKINLFPFGLELYPFHYFRLDKMTRIGSLE